MVFVATMPAKVPKESFSSEAFQAGKPSGENVATAP